MSFKTMREKRIWIVLSILGLTAGYANGISAFSSDNNILKLVTNEWPPWRMKINNQYQGADIEIWKTIAERMHLKIEYQFRI